MNVRTVRILASALGTFAVLAILAGAVFAWVVPSATDGRDEAFWVLSWVGFPIIGTMIALRRPGTRIGWILIAVGAGLGMGITGNGLAAYEVTTNPGTVPGHEWWLVVGGATIIPAFLLVPFLVLYFPQDRITSSRMRVVAKVGAGLGVAIWLTGLIRERNQVSGGTGVDNPIGIDVLSPAVEVAIPLLGGLYGGFAMLVLGNAVWRFFRSRGVERQQMKWFVYAAVMFPVLMTVAGFAEETDRAGTVSTVAATAAFLIALNGMAAAIGIAVTRYRLYDIDVVISRTVVFAGLAAFITAIYVGIVVGVGSLLGAGDEPNLALSVVATAVVAVAFQPARERLTRVANRLVFGKRATPYEVLSRFSSHLGETVATEETLSRMAQLLADGTGAAHAQVSLLIGGAMVPAASVGEVDPSADAHTVDVTHQGETLGALSVTKKRGEQLTPADVKLVDDLAAQAGLLLRNVRLTEELKQRIVDLRESRQRLVAAQDAERRRLERDLHDGAQQQIVAMKLKLGIARTLATKDNAARTTQLVDQLIGETDEAVQTLRELAHGIYPPLLAAEGLAAALATHARRAAVPVLVEAGGIGRYDQAVEAAVYFCVLEAVNNASKYAEPSRVIVRLAESDGQLTFEVTDDGAGFDPATTPKGHGTTNMADRLDALGGQLEILSVPGTGTTVAGQLPAITSEINA